MNEFEWLKQTRSLCRPAIPRHDLWAGIAARIETPATAARPERASRWVPLAMAASLAAASLLAGTLAWNQHHLSVPSSATRPPTVAGATWKPQDPRLAGAAIELHSARMQLTQAIHHHPDSPWLRRMLEYTRHKQHTLQQLEQSAS